MKVASLTLDGYFNYGNILQKFALHYTLKKFADYTEVLFCKDGNKFHNEGIWAFNIPGYVSKDRPQRYTYQEIVRTTKIKEFENRYIRTRFDIPYLDDIGDEYDFFVVGSDQVWNPLWIKPKYFLNFAPNEKKIAYAASIANPEIPDDKKDFFRENLMTFPKISVREEGAVQLIKELTGRNDVQLVLDPVMLLTADEWLKVALKPSWFNEKYERGYILTYYLRKLPPPEIKDLSRKLNLPVINIWDVRNYWHYITGPEEFIYLFANATLVYTNSFHGSAFSILFRRPFVNREYIRDDFGQKMSLRIIGLVKMFGLEDRIAQRENKFEVENLLNPNYNVRDKTLPEWREKSLKFLAEALHYEN